MGRCYIRTQLDGSNVIFNNTSMGIEGGYDDRMGIGSRRESGANFQRR